MTPIKQTVYLPVKLDDEFWTKWDNGEKPDYDLSDVRTGENIESWVNEKEGYFFTPEQLNEYTANVIKQTLETAAEKATLLENGELTYFGRYIIEEGNHYSEIEIDVSKESITITFEETYKKFQV